MARKGDGKTTATGKMYKNTKRVEEIERDKKKQKEAETLKAKGQKKR